MPGSVVRRGTVVAVIALVALGVGVAGLVRGGPTAVHAATDLPPDTVSVTGVGTANGAPDTLTADFRVHVTRASVQQAIDAQAAAARQVLGALERAGVTRRHVTTTELAIDRHYDNHGVVVGYDASETLRARISPLAGAGRTISAAATAAGDKVEVGALSFDIADDDPLVSRARAAAFDDARARATQYAALANRSLGRVLKVTEHVERPPAGPTYYGDALLARSAGKAAALPIRGGRQALTVRVTVLWSLG